MSIQERLGPCLTSAISIYMGGQGLLNHLAHVFGDQLFGAAKAVRHE